MAVSRKKYTEDGFFLEKIKPLMDAAGSRNQREFAEFLGIGGQNITNVKLKKKRIPDKWIHTIAEKKNLSLDHLFNLIKDKPPMENKTQVIQASEAVEENQVLIENAEALGVPEVFKAILEVKRSWVLAEFPENMHDLLVWVMDSDNMAPTIMYRDLLLIDKRITDVQGDGVYAFKINGLIKIRRVMHRMDGALDMINDNRSYPSSSMNFTTIVLPNVKIAGRVIRVMKQI